MASNMPLLSVEDLVEEEGSECSDLASHDGSDVSWAVPAFRGPAGARGLRIVTNADAGLAGAAQLPFSRYVVAWVAGAAFAGGAALLWSERGAFGASRCFFLALSAVTNTGLAPFDLKALRPRSQVLVCLLMQGGSASVVSLAPVVLRLRELERLLPRVDARLRAPRWRWHSTSRVARVTFDLHDSRHYRAVPQWVVEYKALVYLMRVVICYQIAIYSIFGLMLYAYVCARPGARLLGPGAAGTGAAGWTVFTVVSSYTNTGLSLQPNSFVDLAEDHGFILFAVASLSLLGNVLFPACVRWTVVALSAAAKKGSSRKVYYRYLLLHGRRLYSSFFASQQTWLLVATQLFLIAAQCTAALVISWRDAGFAGEPLGLKIRLALFEAVNTRHAGATAVGLDALRGGTLIIYLAAMWLAPVPFVAAIRSSAIRTGPGRASRMRAAAAAEPGDAERRARSADRARSLDNDDISLRTLDGPGRSTSVASNLSSFLDGNVSVSPARDHAQRPPPQSPDPEERPPSDPEERHRRGRSLNALLSESAPSLARGEQKRRDSPERPSLGAVDEGDDDALYDTRLLLIARYPFSAAPLREKVILRYRALRYHAGRQVGAAAAAVWRPSDALVLFGAWFAVVALQRSPAAPAGDADSAALFAALFEVFSAYGNVGLSLGSLRHRSGDFARDLEWPALFVIGVVSVVGRTRGLPSTLDSSLSLPNLESNILVEPPITATTATFVDAPQRRPAPKPETDDDSSVDEGNTVTL